MKRLATRSADDLAVDVASPLLHSRRAIVLSQPLSSIPVEEHFTLSNSSLFAASHSLAFANTTPVRSPYQSINGELGHDDL